KAGSVLINIARGEIIDEDALAGALARDHLRGAALDVYVGEFEHAPAARLWSDPPGVDHAPCLGRQRPGSSRRRRCILRKSRRLRGRAPASQRHRLAARLLSVDWARRNVFGDSALDGLRLW